MDSSQYFQFGSDPFLDVMTGWVPQSSFCEGGLQSKQYVDPLPSPPSASYDLDGADAHIQAIDAADFPSSFPAESWNYNQHELQSTFELGSDIAASDFNPTNASDTQPYFLMLNDYPSQSFLPLSPGSDTADFSSTFIYSRQVAPISAPSSFFNVEPSHDDDDRSSLDYVMEEHVGLSQQYLTEENIIESSPSPFNAPLLVPSADNDYHYVAITSGPEPASHLPVQALDQNAFDPAQVAEESTLVAVSDFPLAFGNPDGGFWFDFDFTPDGAPAYPNTYRDGQVPAPFEGPVEVEQPPVVEEPTEPNPAPAVAAPITTAAAAAAAISQPEPSSNKENSPAAAIVAVTPRRRAREIFRIYDTSKLASSAQRGGQSNLSEKVEEEGSLYIQCQWQTGDNRRCMVNKLADRKALQAHFNHTHRGGRNGGDQIECKWMVIHPETKELQPCGKFLTADGISRHIFRHKHFLKGYQITEGERVTVYAEIQKCHYCGKEFATSGSGDNWSLDRHNKSCTAAPVAEAASTVI